MQPTSLGPRFASSIHSTDAVMTSQEVARASCELSLAGLPSTSLMTTGPVEQAAESTCCAYRSLSVTIALIISGQDTCQLHGCCMKL